MKNKRPYFKPADLLIILIIVSVSLSSFAFILHKTSKNEAPSIAQIRVNSKLTQTIDLKAIETPRVLTVEGNFPVTLEVSKEGVRFLESECPDGLCINSGLIKANMSAACLPAGVSVSVKGEVNAEVDSVVG